MHDRQYRVAIAWQNTGYNQPPHPGFFLGDGMAAASRSEHRDDSWTRCSARRAGLHGDFGGQRGFGGRFRDERSDARSTWNFCAGCDRDGDALRRRRDQAHPV